jgi:3-deoxy-D-manno-octulosonate 8-phosphate phosphatase (KDO 8-P phosphatase)
MKNIIKAKLEKIKLLILDVDGVMTDGRIIMDDAGREMKNFHVRDGHGMKDLEIKDVYQKVFNKKEVFEKILKKHKLSADEAAFMGDDIVDIPVLKRAGFSAAVADAVDEVKSSVHYITQNTGGHGAVRELCEMILQAQDKWREVADRYEFKTNKSNKK